MPIVETLVAICVVADVLAIWAVFRGREDGEEPTDNGDGGARRPRPPGTPPPEPSTSWPDFERQFAEYVDSMRLARSGTGGRDRMRAER